MFIKINISKEKYFVFGAIYRSPNCSEKENDDICTQIYNVSKRFHGLDQKYVIVGDFNYPEID